jgi:Holliday junction resolvase RusA-like endonuclease
MDKTTDFKPADEIEQAWRAGYLQGLTSAHQKRLYSEQTAQTAQKIKIVGKMPSLNEYIEACRRNAHCGARLKSNVEAGIIPQLAKLKKIEKPVHITFIWHEINKRRDKDNVAAAKKFILDALQKAGKLINDNNDYIAGFTDRFEYGGKEYGCTLIIEGANNE